MNSPPVLYVGAAAPLVEAAYQWMAEMPQCATAEDRQAKLKAFPHNRIGAYRLSFPQPEYIIFRTGVRVNVDRVRQTIEQWSGKPPELLGDAIFNPIAPLDHRKALQELKRILDKEPVQRIARVGLTLQQLQRELSEFHPDLVLLDCHGTEEGCLLFEDGRGHADYIAGDRLFRMLRPRPAVLFLAACYSQSVLNRSPMEDGWKDSAIVSIDDAKPLEVTAAVGFQSMFFPAILRGETAGEAFNAAIDYVANDAQVGDFSVASGDAPPSKKFRINDTGRSVRLPKPSTKAHTPMQEALQPSPRSGTIRRSSDRFVGRQREMTKIIDALLPLPAGIHLQPGGERRVVTLTKEGGIGKTALALEISDWVDERRQFPGGVFELSCERLVDAEDFRTRLLLLFGVPPVEQRGDLLELLSRVLEQPRYTNQPTLLLLDNLDDLFGRHVLREVRDQAAATLETALTSAPTLRILATCRWQLGLADHENDLGIPPLAEDEARDVFLSHLTSAVHRAIVDATWEQPDSAVRQLVRMSGRHPQSLRLLARQTGRPGMTLERLRDEAREDLLKVLADPLASDDEDDRQKKAAVSYGLSYRHLSDPAKLLFQRLSRLPGGVWRGQLAEHLMDWRELLGEDWREVLERELDYFALVHFDPENDEGSGVFEMLPPMLEFAREKYSQTDDKEWEKTWIEFWRQRIGAWNQMVSGIVSEEMDVTEDERGAMGAFQRQVAMLLFERTEANWLEVFDHAVATDSHLAKWFLLEMISFCELSGQRILCRSLAVRAVEALRSAGDEEDLAACLGTLGTVQSDLGEREAARDSYTEALEIYMNLAAQWPAAFADYFFIALRNYVAVAAEDTEDRWVQLWKELQETEADAADEELKDAREQSPVTSRGFFPLFGGGQAFRKSGMRLGGRSSRQQPHNSLRRSVADTRVRWWKWCAGSIPPGSTLVDHIVSFNAANRTRQ